MAKHSGKKPTLLHENRIRRQGIQHILGMDEAGRGAWAGPVTVGAICLPLDRPDLRRILTHVRDSKLMTPRQREGMAEQIKEVAVAWGVGHASNFEIDEQGINLATRLAMQRALDEALQRFPQFTPDCLFLDALIWPEQVDAIPQVSIVDGDARSFTIAAASILAKTARDGVMRDLDSELPHYDFGGHKGYGTAQHTAALKLYGLSPLHRRSFAPIRKLMVE